MDKYKEAIDCYNQVISLDPNNSSAFYNKGNSLHNLGKY
jgi:tetratricopeptide (TPR) repeat protein